MGSRSAPRAARWGTLWGTTITQRPPAVLIALNVVLAGVLLALPFLGIGVVLLGRGRSRARAGALVAWILALLCLGVAVAGIAAELVRGSTAVELLDRAGGAALVFGLCGVVHAIGGVAGTRPGSGALAGGDGALPAWENRSAATTSIW